jgi:hypothetical protein
MDEWMVGWLDGWMDGCMYYARFLTAVLHKIRDKTDRKTDRQIHESNGPCMDAMWRGARCSLSSAEISAFLAISSSTVSCGQ